MKRIIGTALVFVSLILIMSESPYFPYPNFVGLFLLAILSLAVWNSEQKQINRDASSTLYVFSDEPTARHFSSGRLRPDAQDSAFFKRMSQITFKKF